MTVMDTGTQHTNHFQFSIADQNTECEIKRVRTYVDTTELDKRK